VFQTAPGIAIMAIWM